MLQQYVPYALATVAAVCQVTTAGFAIWSTSRARKFERALRLMQTGPRLGVDARTRVAPVYHAPAAARR